MTQGRSTLWFGTLAVTMALAGTPRAMLAQASAVGCRWARTGAGEYVSSADKRCRPLPSGLARAEVQVAGPALPNPGKAFLLSALVPGGGQYLLGQDRWVAYVGVELWAWIQFESRRRDGQRLERRYRDLAWYVARRVSSGPRTEGGWDYYEAMTQYDASGAYDMDPAEAGVQPEADPLTYNGRIWELAQEIYLPEDPDVPPDEESSAYAKAFHYYLNRAYRPDFAWNWGSATLQREEYARLIRASDENLRRSTTMIGVILANHLLSAVDALVSVRLGVTQPREPHLIVLPQRGLDGSRQLALRVHLPLAHIHEH